MRDILPTLDRWLAEGHRFALATVVQTWGSSPRPVGSAMGVRDDGVVVGSVSGGCVESAVIEGASEALKAGEPKRLSFASIDERQIWEVGLTCGGKIDVWIEPEPYSDPVWREAAEAVRSGRPAVLVTQFQPLQRWTDASLPVGPIRPIRPIESSQELDGCFVQLLPTKDRLLIIGASHIALPLIQMAKVLGFETVVIDPRSQLLVDERFPDRPDQTIHGWPQPILAEMTITPSTYAVVLSHDPKIDDAALTILLRSPAAYIGALGSKLTREKRQAELKALGFTDEELARIHGPIGLKIGARSPEEIALSILAEIVQVRGR
jgi:xanthine dehydrogenase accessory factor